MITIAAVAYAMQAPFTETFYRVGEQTRNFDGGLASQTKTEKRIWRGTTSFLSAAELATLRAATDLDEIVTVVDTVRGISMQAMVRTEAELSIATLWTVRLDMQEV